MRLPHFAFPALAAGAFFGITWSLLFAQDSVDRAGPSLMAAKARETPGAKLAARRTSVVELVERVKSCVVNIHSERLVQGQTTQQELLALAPTQNRINGMGTGNVIDPRGYVVTNHHVVEDVNSIRVKLADGTSCGAQVVAVSRDQDLALLKIEVAQRLPVMPLGTAQDLMVGETVTAIGNAYGYEHTVSSGIVSAVKRDVTLNKEISYKSLIQTNASINPGNSGGPLINVNGELIGVNVAIRAGAQGIGFAIPVDTMIRVVGEMLKTKLRQVTYDGMTVRDQLDPSADGLLRTVVVERVEPGSPAAQANIQRGDTIVRVGDVTVQCSFDVDRALLDRAANDHLAVTYRRLGQDSKTDLVLQSTDRTKTNVTEMIWRKLGVSVTPLNGESVARVNRQLHGGLEIVQVSPEGAAGRAGIKKGDILVGLHQWETLTPDNVAFVVTNPDLTTFLPLSFYIVRGGQVRRGYIQQLD